MPDVLENELLAKNVLKKGVSGNFWTALVLSDWLRYNGRTIALASVRDIVPNVATPLLATTGVSPNAAAYTRPTTGEQIAAGKAILYRISGGAKTNPPTRQRITFLVTLDDGQVVEACQDWEVVN